MGPEMATPVYSAHMLCRTKYIPEIIISHPTADSFVTCFCMNDVRVMRIMTTRQVPQLALGQGCILGC